MTVRYQVGIADAHAHLYEVEARFPAGDGPLALWMPVWTPGSYLVREFARQVQDFAAFDAAGKPLPFERKDKNTWVVSGKGERSVRYRVYANELTVRTSHLDDSHGFFNGANLFLTSDAHLGRPCQLVVSMPEGWKASCALPSAAGVALAGNSAAFAAKDFDELVDSPVEMGTHALLTFEAAGKPHEVAIWGQGNYDPKQLTDDLKAICETEAKVFGGLPFDRYLFILHLTDKGRGGLEHAQSTVLLCPRQGFKPRKSYEDLLALASHEYFHLWNVKRIKPKALVPFDYQRENYTRLLWAFEGFTSYFDTLLLRRAGLIDAGKYLEKLGEAITALQSVPARRVQRLDEASLVTWVKYYRQDENTPNSGVSYYVKGEVVAALLDVALRAATDGKRSLDDLMRLLFERYGDGRGVPEEGVEAAALELGGAGLKEFFDRALRSTEELDYSLFEKAGLSLKTRPKKNAQDKGGTRGEDHDADAGWLGVELKSGDKAVVATTLHASPAEKGGLYADDELIAVDDAKVSGSNLLERIGERRAGEKVRVALFRREQLLERTVELSLKPAEACYLEKLAQPSESQRALLAGWLGQDLWSQEAKGA